MRTSVVLMVSATVLLSTLPCSARFKPARQLVLKGLYYQRSNPLALQTGQCDCVAFICNARDYALTCEGRISLPNADKPFVNKGRLTGVQSVASGEDQGCEVCGCNDEVSAPLNLEALGNCMDSN